MTCSDQKTRPSPIKEGADRSGVLVHVVPDNASTLQDELEEAISIVRASDSGNRQGIMITRHSEALFTVTYSPDVPFGTTLEQDRWRRRC